MKFTSEDLLKFLKLSVGDTIKVYHNKKGSSFEYLIYEVIIDEFENVMLNCEQLHKVQISFLANKDYEIIQPKPTLTEDEKVILRNLPKEYKWIARDKIGSLLCCFINKPTRTYNGIVDEKVIWHDIDSHPTEYIELPYPHLFQFIKWEDEPYSIEELLGEEKLKK